MKKEKIIQEIKSIIEEWGAFSPSEVDGEEAPIVKTLGKNNSQLAEHFSIDGVKVVTYVHETETDENEVDYKDLSKDVLEEILRIAENYKVDFEKTMNRCKN